MSNICPNSTLHAKAKYDEKEAIATLNSRNCADVDTRLNVEFKLRYYVKDMT